MPFLVYIDCLSTGLSSNPWLFADDTSLFLALKPAARDRNISANELNNDLLKIRNWAYQWKMSFKEGQEVNFFRKIKKLNHPMLIFNIDKSNSISKAPRYVFR